MPEPGREPDPNLRLLGDVLSYGWVLPACLAAGGGLGWLVDRWLGSFPAATLLLGLLGFAGGIRQLDRIIILSICSPSVRRRRGSQFRVKARRFCSPAEGQQQIRLDKARAGGPLCLWIGAENTQKIFRFAAPDDLRVEFTARNREEFLERFMSPALAVQLSRRFKCGPVRRLVAARAQDEH